MKTIFVLTNSKDGKHSDVIIAKLRNRGARVFRFDSDRLSRGDAEITFYANRSKFMFELANGDKLDSTDVRCVFFRRPYEFDFNISDPVQKTYAENQLRHFLESTWLTLNNIFWMNDPYRSWYANHKMVQLQFAQAHEMRFPDTIVTNYPDEVRRFLSDHDNRIVFKSHTAGNFKYNDKSYGNPTTLVTEQHLSKLELVRSLPSLFQHHVNKSKDVRVTVVGNRIFPVSIDSQTFEESRVDYRQFDSPASLKHEIIQVPKTIENFCLACTDYFRLNYGAFDFAIDEREEWVWFEINPNGQFYWVEQLLPDIGITDAITDLLIKQL